MNEITRTPDVIAGEIKAIESTVKTTALHGAIEIGKRLNEVKEQLPHGEWRNWCAENLGYSQDKAGRYMQLYSEYGNSGCIPNLGIRAALRLLTLPEEERETFTETHDVENASARELEKQIREYKAQLEAKDGEIGILNEKISDMRSDFSETLKNAQTVEVVREVVPADYEESKKKAKLVNALEKDLRAEKNKYAEKQNEILRLQDELKKLRHESEDEINGLNFKENILFFEAGVLSFLDQYGGMAWLTGRIEEMPEALRKRYLRAITSIYAWAQAQIETLGGLNGYITD